MERGYLIRNGSRVRFRMRTPKCLWEVLPKVIAKEITTEYQDGITEKCRRCGERLKELFDRAVKGMVNREILRELAEQICNEELYRLTPTQSLLDLPKNLPSNSALLQSFFGKILESLHIKLDLPQDNTPSQTQAVTVIHPLKKTVDLYIHEKSENVNVNLKTEKDRTNALGLLVEYLGEDFDINLLSRALMVDIRSNLLRKYPKNRKKHYPGMSLQEVLQLKNVKVYISETTVNRYLEFWNGFFNWSVQADHMTKNPLTGLTEKAEYFDVRELRPPFTAQELTAIFRMIADLPNRPRFMPKLYPMRFWVNVLALYQGMRLNEICQLYLDDIVMVEGIPCIRIKADKSRMQKVKNKSSVRTIPIHSTVLRLGFMDYCCEIKDAADGRLDTVLFQPATALDGGYQRKMQQFNALIHALPEVDKKKSMHSYRHCFDSELLNKGAEEYFILCLDGHTRNGELMRRYAKPDMHRLQKTIEMATYDGFDIFNCLHSVPQRTAKIESAVKRFFFSLHANSENI